MIGRENSQLGLLRAAIARLETESKKLDRLNARMEMDPNFDPLSNGALPINAQPRDKVLSPVQRGASTSSR